MEHYAIASTFTLRARECRTGSPRGIPGTYEYDPLSEPSWNQFKWGASAAASGLHRDAAGPDSATAVPAVHCPRQQFERSLIHI